MITRRCFVCREEVEGGDDGIACARGHRADLTGWYVVDGDTVIGLGHPHAGGYLREPGTPPLDGCVLAAALKGGQAAAVILTSYTVVAAGEPDQPGSRVREAEAPDDEGESYVLTYREDGSTVLLDLGEPVRPIPDSTLLRRFRAARRRAFAPHL